MLEELIFNLSNIALAEFVRSDNHRIFTKESNKEK